MKDQKSNKTNHPPNTVSSHSPLTYQMLVRQSEKMGAVATKAFGDLKHLLNQEINLPPAADQLLDGLRTLRPKVIDKNLQKIAELKKVIKKSNEVLASAQTVALFSDKIVVDRTKITIIKRSFFWSADVISIQIEDILNVSSSVGPLFGSLTIASRVMSTTDHFQVNFFWRSDALELKRVIQGYAIAKHSGIDIGQLPKAEMLETLRELGRDTGS